MADSPLKIESFDQLRFIQQLYGDTGTLPNHANPSGTISVADFGLSADEAHSLLKPFASVDPAENGKLTIHIRDAGALTQIHSSAQFEIPAQNNLPLEQQIARARNEWFEGLSDELRKEPGIEAHLTFSGVNQTQADILQKNFDLQGIKNEDGTSPFQYDAQTQTLKLEPKSFSPEAKAAFDRILPPESSPSVAAPSSPSVIDKSEVAYFQRHRKEMWQAVKDLPNADWQHYGVAALADVAVFGPAILASAVKEGVGKLTEWARDTFGDKPFTASPKPEKDWGVFESIRPSFAGGKAVTDESDLGSQIGKLCTQMQKSLEQFFDISHKPTSASSEKTVVAPVIAVASSGPAVRRP